MTTDSAKHKALTFMRQHHMGVLSTASDDGKPWGAAVYFVVDDDFKLYFVTRSDTYKYQNIEKNPRVALTVADEPSQTSVQLSGTVSSVPVHDYMEVVFRKLANIRPKDDFAWSPPVDKVQGGDYMPLCVTPDKLQFADYKQHKHDLHDRDFIERII